jgi:glycosyltransferase involved in cell wall biosynthesis
LPEVFPPQNPSGNSVKTVVDGINVFYAPFFPLYPFHIWLHGLFVGRILKSLEPKLTLVHLHSPISPPIKTTLPVITTVHTPMKIDVRYHEINDVYSLAERAQSTVVYPPIESRLFQLSKLVTAVSLSVAKELAEYGLDPNKIPVLGNGVDEQLFTPSQRKARSRYVLYTGVLRARKGLFDFIECAKYVSSAYPDVKFVICGKGSFLDKLKEEARRLGVEKQMVFLGYVTRNKLVQTYQKATIHVVPSHYEGLPTVLLEAMSCGLPVVATDVGGNKEVISNGVNGFLVPPKSPKVIARTILRLLEDDDLRTRIGGEARETVERLFTWDKIAGKILDCYKSVVEN